MQIVIYENQRWWVNLSWSDKTLSSERAPWSDLSGNMYLPKGVIKLPHKGCEWSSEWQVQQGTTAFLAERKAKMADHDGSYDPEGWQYAMDFTKSFSGTRSMADFVRRRKWVRTCAEKDAKPKLKSSPSTLLTEKKPAQLAHRAS